MNLHLNSVGKEIWSFSRNGMACLKTCWRLCKPEPVLKVRDVPSEELLKYELLWLLENAGWRMQVASSGKGLDPFLHGQSQALVWYIKTGKDVTSIPLSYLRLLLTAADHGKPVPHLCNPGRYNQLLSSKTPLTLMAPKGKHALQLECDDWGLLEPKRKRVRSGRKVVDSQIDSLLALFDDNDAGPGHHQDLDSDGGSASDIGAVDDIPDVPLPAASSKPPAHAEMVLEQATPSGAVKKPEESSSSSSTTSSSSSTGDSSDSDKEDDRPSKPVGGGKKQLKGHAKKFRGDNWGLCLLTPRYKGSKLCGLQMLCSRPEHNIKKKCTKELSFGVAGGQNICRRMLKSWIVFGSSVSSRDEHMFESWKMILALKKDSALPLENELDQHVVHDWDKYSSVESAAQISAPAPHSMLPESENLLGSAEPGVPESVHRHMEELASVGAIPVSTTKQRSRNKKTPHTTYGVPPWLSDAIRYHYIHPNLPAPKGCVWRFSSGNSWILCVKGG